MRQLHILYIYIKKQTNKKISVVCTSAYLHFRKHRHNGWLFPTVSCNPCADWRLCKEFHFFLVCHLKFYIHGNFNPELLLLHNKYWRLTFGIRVGLAPTPTLSFRSSWWLHSLLFLLYIHHCIFTIPIFVRTICVTIWISIFMMKFFSKQSLYFRDIDLLKKIDRKLESELHLATY